MNPAARAILLDPDTPFGGIDLQVIVDNQRPVPAGTAFFPQYLQRAGYDFRAVWFSDQAEQIRKTIKEDNCQCPLANAAYTNMLLHAPTLMRVAARTFGMNRKQEVKKSGEALWQKST